jgi:hypothetical protein
MRGTGSNGAGSFRGINPRFPFIFGFGFVFGLALDFDFDLDVALVRRDGPGSSSDSNSSVSSPSSLSSSLPRGDSVSDLNHDLLFFFLAATAAAAAETSLSDLSVGESSFRLLSDRRLGIVNASTGGARP